MTAQNLATPEDLRPLLELINQAYEVEAFFIEGPRVGAADLLARIVAREIVVLRDGARLVAAAHVQCEDDVAHLGLVSVDPTLQGRGLGRQIVEEAELVACGRGATTMHLQVVHLRDELPPFYRKLGYAEYGTSDFDTKDTLLPVHFIDMKKPIEHSRAR